MEFQVSVATHQTGEEHVYKNYGLAIPYFAGVKPSEGRSIELNKMKEELSVFDNVRERPGGNVLEHGTKYFSMEKLSRVFSKRESC
jgi:hypothetical protein